MAFGSIKRRVDFAADSSDLQISKMNSFEFNVVMKNNRLMFFVFIKLIISKGNMPLELKGISKRH